MPPAVYPAVPKGRALLRFCVTSCHREDQIREALDKLDQCAKACGIQLPKPAAPEPEAKTEAEEKAE